MQIDLDLYVSLLSCLSHAYLSCQLSDVAKGLCYLHSCNIIHGDLKGVRGYSKSCFAAVLTPHELNILVNDSGHALITDFGLAMVVRNLDSILSAPLQHGHTQRWAAPEILKEGPNSRKADVFAFAMVMIEVCHGWSTARRVLAYRRLILMQVFTGAIPFGNCLDFQVMVATMEGRRPPRPTHPIFTEQLWTLMQQCWNHDPHLRPEASEALEIILTLSVSCSFCDCIIVNLTDFPYAVKIQLGSG
jgi:serine/threonine protein kinase